MAIIIIKKVVLGLAMMEEKKVSGLALGCHEENRTSFQIIMICRHNVDVGSGIKLLNSCQR